MDGEFQGYTFDLPDNTGRIHHYWSIESDRLKQINDLFRAFQQDDVGALLRRNPLSKHKGGGGAEFLTRQCKPSWGTYHRAPILTVLP